MKLFGNSRRRREPTAAPPDAAQSPRAAQREAADAPAQRQSDGQSAQRRSTARTAAPQGRGMLILAVLALAGVLILCPLLILFSGKTVMPEQLAVGGTSGDTQESDTQADTQPPEPDGIPLAELHSTYDSRQINFLIAGVSEDGLTNTLLLAGIDLDEGTLSLVSVPRESYISGNYDVPMLNRVYQAAGGAERGVAGLKEKYKEMFGFWVDYYLIVDAEALVQMVDLAGGIEFDVPSGLDYSEAQLNTGTQRLSGAQAVGLFRFRQTYDEVDTRCTQIQREFVLALLQQAVAGLTEEELNTRMETLLPLLDTDLTQGNLNWLAQFLQQADWAHCYHKALLGEVITLSRTDYYELDEEDTLDVINLHFNPTGKDLTRYDIHLRQESGNAGDGTVPTYWWQMTESDSDEQTDEDGTEPDDSSEWPDDSSESTPTPSESEIPIETDPPSGEE